MNILATISSAARADAWRRRTACTLAACAALMPLCVHGAPYAEPGEEVLRHDLELLTDRGLIDIPLTSWPLMWADVAAAVDHLDDLLPPEPALAAAIARLRSRIREETRSGISSFEYRLALSGNSRRLRLFDNTPRSDAELEGGIAATGDRFAARLRLAVIGNPDDGKDLRADGSFAAAAFGNTAVSLGWQDKWWGPGWAGTLGLSNNARPIPGLLVQRITSTPFESPWLRWIGPWSYQVTFGRMEEERAVPRPYLFGMRVNFKPLQRLELGVSRTAQWGGEGRTESFASFVDMLLGRDNEGSDGLSDATEPGNQLAGFDARWTVKRGAWPVVVYGQLMGEDEAGGFPSKYLGQFGVSTTVPWGRNGAVWHLRAEYSDTTCQFHERSRIFDCAYNNSQFPTGYRYRGNAIGHSTDNDARQLVLAGHLLTATNQRLSGALRVADLNRGGAFDAANSLTPVPQDLLNAEFTYARETLDGVLTVGVGVDRIKGPQISGTDHDPRAFVQWRRSGSR